MQGWRAMDGQALEEAIRLAEARFGDVRPASAKCILWADTGRRERTRLAFLYVHGFSAGPGETRPLPDRIAAAFGANLYFTRLTGHGRTGEAMGEATMEAWLGDFAEALSIGRQIGERLVVIGCSTGAALATVALAAPENRRDVGALVKLSPNFRIRAAGGFLLHRRVAKPLVRLLVGPRRGFVPLNAAHAALWTTDYPVEALFPMARLVHLANRAPVETIDLPALFVRSPADQVVDARATDAIAARWGGPKAVIDPGPVGDPFAHVIAGDALSPATTEPLAQRITQWLAGVLR